MFEDFDQEHDLQCPHCGHSPIHSRDCSNLFCEEGTIDDSEDDPINFYPGESTHLCEECRGTGVERWCPGCGQNLSEHHFEEWDEEQ